MRLTAPLLATALALTMAGCADDVAGPGPTAAQSQSSSSDPQALLRRLEAAVAVSPTVHVEIELEVDGRVSARAKGVQDLARNSMDMDVTAGSRDVGYRLVGGRYYLARPPTWVPVRPGSRTPLIQQIRTLSLRNLLDAFAAGVETAGVTGRQDVDGVRTTHHTTTVDTQQAFAELGMDVAEGTPESIRCDFWVGEDDLIRRVRFSQNGTTTTMTATDWGQPVTIEKPKHSQLATAPGSGTG